MRSLSSPKITASPSKAMRSCPAGRPVSIWSAAAAAVSPGGLGRMVAAGMPWRNALRTVSGLADRNRSVPNGFT
ncbi:hypothetical protein G6F21_014494 [Rhizopus arrhizus]|nr:hypothetical protein G6F21_014494 [Rhizopus arrhizus]